MFKGSMPAMVTPFKDGTVDFDTLKHLTDWLIDEGSHGLVPVGTTGESPTLSHEEHEAVVECVVKQAAGRVPVIAGAGSNNSVETIRFVQHAETVDGLRFIYCDTIEPRTHVGHLCAARANWLEAELAAADRALVFFHHNPLHLGAPSEDILSLNDADQARLHPILARHRDRIAHLFFGHVHTPLCGTLAGIPFSGVPSTCAQQGIPDLAPGELLKSAQMDPSYRVVLMRGDDIVIHQIPFAWDGPVTESGTGWDDWAKPQD